jgi:hypothetical protein
MTTKRFDLKQLEKSGITPARLYAKCYERVTEGAGYQMFGYDWPTIKVTHPHLAAVMWECVRIHHEVSGDQRS